MSKNPTVLLAEDDPAHQHKTRVLLEECGCRVVEAMDGEEAVSLAASIRVDLLMLDLKMPLLDGYEAARRIRGLNGMDKVPLVAYTADYSYSLTEGAIEAGFDEYIVKPVDVEKMRELLERYFPDRTEKGVGE